MKTRLITGTCYVLVLVAFFLLKIFVNDLFFDGLLWLFCIVGVHEMLNAFGSHIAKSQRVVTMLFAVLFLPAFAVCETLWGTGMLAMTIAFAVGAILILSLLVFDYAHVTLEGTGGSMVAMVYPALFLGLLALCNHFPVHSALAILLIFVVSPFADSIAYVFGVALHKKLPKKMSPQISPNKTLIGGLGGLVGGLIGSLIVCFSYHAVVPFSQELWMVAIAFALIGIVAAVFTAFGDLVESAIKRKVGIKDMGKILPGHGGILDRIDGTLYITVFIYLLFVLFSL